jgi:hypothetical protein
MYDMASIEWSLAIAVESKNILKLIVASFSSFEQCNAT